MDEILASIRRIIESGDEPADEARGGTSQSASASAPIAGVPLPATSANASPVPLPRFDVHYVSPADGLDSGYSEDDLRDLEAAELDRDDPHSEAHATSDDVSGPRLDGPAEPWTAPPSEPVGIQSQGEAAVQRGAEHDQRTSAVPPPAGNENAAPAEDEADSARTDPTSLSRNFSFEFDDEAFEAELQSDAWYGAAPAPHPVEAAHPTSAEDTSAPVRIEMPASVIDGASALLSAQAGDQVAAAFDDLTRAIRDGQMRSMEDMAREMMRPMLQEWLDDNLPRIVERLVRDEIERIARGPRR